MSLSHVRMPLDGVYCDRACRELIMSPSISQLQTNVPSAKRFSTVGCAMHIVSYLHSLWSHTNCFDSLINPLSAKLINLNFHPLEVVSR